MSAAAAIVLKHPITCTLKGPEGDREETISEVTLRRIKGKDLRVVDTVTGEVAATLALISKISGLPIAQVDQLDAEDIAVIGAMIEDFMPPGLLTGKTPSAT